MKKLMLNWLFGVDNIKDYMDLLVENINCRQEHIKEIENHIETLNREKENIDIMLKLIKICENHGINVDEEIKHVEL